MESRTSWGTSVAGAFAQPAPDGGDRVPGCAGAAGVLADGDVDQAQALPGVGGSGGVQQRGHELVRPGAGTGVGAERLHGEADAAGETFPAEVLEPADAVVEPEGVVAAPAVFRRFERLYLPALVGEDELKLPVAPGVPTGRARRWPVVAGPRVGCLPDPAARCLGAADDPRPDPAEHLARDHDLVVGGRERVVGGELRGAVGARGGVSGPAAFQPPPPDQAHRLVDQVLAVEGGTVVGVVVGVLADLGDEPAGVVEGLVRAEPVQDLAAVTGHVAVAGIERHHRLRSVKTMNGMPSATSRRLVMGGYSRPR
jgi:hypothetical protein